MRRGDAVDMFSGDVDHHALIGTDENLSAFFKFERMMEAQMEEEERQKKAKEAANRLTREQIEEIQLECVE